jgi:hypothetical protein
VISEPAARISRPVPRIVGEPLLDTATDTSSAAAVESTFANGSGEVERPRSASSCFALELLIFAAIFLR